ncbi:MAG: hypothetical protein IJS22_07005 [Lachnospiraceae bacterium]|nr:hypothetical protein [Lachnospiraceae bacterium]
MKKTIRKMLGFVLAAAMVLSVFTAVQSRAEAAEPALSMQALVADTITARFIADIDSATEANYESIVLRAALGSSDPAEISGTKNSAGQFVFDYKDIYSQRMSDPITGKVIGIEAGGAESVLAEITDGVSIASYCDQLHTASPDDADLNAFMARMLDFGAKCQAYTGWNTSDLANKADWVQTAVATAGEPAGAIPTDELSVRTEGAAAAIKAVFLRIKNKAAICLRIVGSDLEGASVVVTSDSIDRTFALANEATDEAIVKNGTEYVISLDEFAPKQFDEVITARLYAGAVDAANLQHTVKYSINTYLVNKKDSAEIGDLVRAMYIYGTAAEAYAASHPDPVRIHVMDMESAELDSVPVYNKVHYAWGNTDNPGDPQLGLAKAAGKGFNGSAAIEYKLLGTAEKPIFIRMDNIAEYPTDLTGTDVFWFWIDTTGISRAIKLEPQLYSTDWKMHRLQLNKEYYLWSGGEVTTAATVEAWGGQTFGRLSLAQNFKGFIGIPFSSFYEGGGSAYNETAYQISDIKGMYFSLPNPNAGETLYIDEFWATSAGVLPDVVFQKDPVRIHVMDMEDAALDNPTGEMLQYPWGGEGTSVTLTKAAGKGFNGSAAIEYKMLAADEKIVRIRMDKINAYPTDLTGSDIFWMWLDASGISRQMNLELQLYSTSWKDYNLKIGETFYLWNGGAVTSSTTVDAWNHIKGRVPLPQGYVGFIGIPYSAFYNEAEDGSDNVYSIADIKGIRFDIPNPNAGEVLYIDEFWATETGLLPDVTFPAASEDKLIHVMDMESSALDATPEYEKVYSPWLDANETTLSKVAGKGFNGTSAIQYTVNTNSWRSGMVMRTDNISDYTTNLTDTDTYWFWIDGSGTGKEITLEPRLYASDYNYVMMKIGTPFYLWNGGLVSEGQSVVAYNGATIGRITLPKNYTGFVGIPYSSMFEKSGDNHDMADFSPSRVNGFYIQFTNASSGDTLYVDEIWATENGVLPGVSYTAPAKVQIHAMDMENSSLDAAYPNNENALTNWWSAGDAVSAEKVAGAGFNGSAAIKYTVNTPAWNSHIGIRMDGSGYSTNMSGTSRFWFWIDTSHLNKETPLELRLYYGDWKLAKYNPGSQMYLWDGSDVKLAISYDGYDSQGRIRIPSGYKGFIGVDYSDFDTDDSFSLDVVRGMMFYLSDAAAGDYVYVDEYWSTDSTSLPNVSFN